MPTSVTPDARRQAITLIQKVLGAPGHAPEPREPLRWLQPMASSPEPQVDSQNDPLGLGRLAVQEALRNHPDAMRKVGRVEFDARSQAPDLPEDRLYGNVVDDPRGPLITLLMRDPDTNQPRTFNSLLTTLRHELAHVMGGEEPEAYGIQDASALLHRDVELPAERLIKRHLTR